MIHPSKKKVLCLKMIVIVASFFSLPMKMADADEKITIGAVEDVILLPWNVKMPARIDTGAATSSLDVKEIVQVGKREIEFRLPERCGDLRIRLPVIGWRTIKSSEGTRERRAVIELEICLGPNRLQTQVTLNDRSSMEFPLLIGRKTLKGNFIVDVSRSHMTPPTCVKEQSP